MDHTIGLKNHGQKKADRSRKLEKQSSVIVKCLCYRTKTNHGNYHVHKYNKEKRRMIYYNIV
jgi:hypothetical protein